MIDLPIKAEVHCSDGAAGLSAYVIVNPINHQVTHLVIQSKLSPNFEHLVPVEQVEETTPILIKLKCTQDDFEQMKLFTNDEFIPTEIPSHLSWPYYVPIPGPIFEETAFIHVEH